MLTNRMLVEVVIVCISVVLISVPIHELVHVYQCDCAGGRARFLFVSTDGYPWLNFTVLGIGNIASAVPSPAIICNVSGLPMETINDYNGSHEKYAAASWRRESQAYAVQLVFVFVVLAFYVRNASHRIKSKIEGSNTEGSQMF